MNIKTICFLVIFISGAMLCRADETIDNSQQNQTQGDQQLQGFNLNGYNNNGEKAWDVNGTQANISDSDINIKNVNANFYGKQPANLTADQGTIDKTNGNVHLQNNVIITSVDRGTQMTTDALDWIRNKDLVTTTDPVKIVDSEGVITGQGMSAHPNLKKAQINQDVHATMHTKPADAQEDQIVTITSDGPMMMNQATGYAVFIDHVISIEASTGRELDCDKMEIWIDSVTKHIKKAICTGHVVAIQGPNRSYANKMIYEGDTQILTMIGRPKIIFDTSSTKGGGLFQPLGGGGSTKKSKAPKSTNNAGNPAVNSSIPAPQAPGAL